MDEKKSFYDVVQCPVDFDTDHGRITVHDGYAAGSSWLLVEFYDGDLKGKKLWMCNDEFDAMYMPNQSDDGYLFNYPPGTTDGERDLVEGGEYLPDLELTIWIS